MRDLIFSNDSGTLNVTFRTDLANGQGKFFTIYEIRGVDALALGNTHAEKVMGAFSKYRQPGGGPYSVEEFVALATHYGFNLTSMETNGNDAVLLVDLGSGS